MDRTIYWFTSELAHAGCWVNTRKACKLRTEIISFPPVPVWDTLPVNQ